uniref:TonB-dependent receptor n=1 Tax=uncultured Alteromonadaceae bacterium TaxID=191625 RepID=A0A0D3MFC7_9ALTE|nr:TonB-dependent receptor [uncultured Alteromonadaceae bacterium]
MGANPFTFKKKLLASSISSCLLATAGAAVAQDQVEEEVVVRGIRASIETSINAKRASATIIDAISAEDIGKLPDVTISDSLQRISGVQIRRSAGEGAAINIRGLPQVVTQLNGEQYLGANSVVSTQPNFGDIPSQLIRGAEVAKSAEARMGVTGISGTVNLKTYRPFDMDEGLTVAGSAELQSGQETGETDPVLSGLLNWQNEKVGFLLGAVYSNTNLSNSYNGANTSSPDDFGWTSTFEQDGAQYVALHGIAAWNQVTERDRLGANAAIQVDLGDGFTLSTELFYTKQDEYNRMVGISATNKWQGWDFIDVTEGQETEVEGFNVWTAAELSPKRVKSFTQNESYNSFSRNLNVELDYDNGGAFTGQFRAIVGSAERAKRHGYNEGDMTNGQSTLGTTTAFLPADKCRDGDDVQGSMGGCFQELNPNGYPGTPTITYNTAGEHPTWGGFDNVVPGGTKTLREYMSDLSAYNVGAFSSENNEDASGDLQVFSLKGNYAFEDSFITSVDMGIRSSQRSTEFERYHLFSPFHNKGCEAQWKATDVNLNSTSAGACTDGELVTVAGEQVFQPYTVLGNVPLDQYNNVIQVSDYGPVNGIPSVWAVDPHDYDNPEAFHNRVFGSTSKHTVPGSTFTVDMNDLMYFGQANYEIGQLTGNFGIRVIDTDLTVKQNLGGPNKPYGNTQLDTGDVLSKRSYTTTLPSLNINYALADDINLRFAYTEAMTPLDLDQWGDGLTVNTALDSEVGSPTEGQFIATSGTSNGNPNLNPWKSSNIDVSAEWYFGSASMVSAGVFKLDIDSFIVGSSELQAQPDADGVVRREVPITLNAQGEGGTLKGLEIGTKVSFGDFTDGVMSNFGIDTNLTLSPSEGSDDDIRGDKNLFPDNSETQFNLIGWFESDRFSARIAYNYRSERLVTLRGAAGGMLNVYQAPTTYVDISASYDITDEVSVYLNGSNVTGEYEEYYLDFEDQFGSQNYYEPRYTVGVRARF